MPNFDAGHYFLTLFAPIRTDPLTRDGQSHSRRHLIKEALSVLPTGERTVASQGEGVDNPFARSSRTHFARLFVLDDVPFNGRVSGDTLLARIGGVDPLVPQPVDRLSTAFLIVAIDFDAASGDDSELMSYAAELWGAMGAEIRAVFQHCHGFDGVKDAESFFRYAKRCQVETTMPFNDYWFEKSPNLPAFDTKPYIAAAAAALVFGLVATVVSGRGWPLLLGLAAVVLVVVLGVRGVTAAARHPLPRSPASAPQSDLPTVLKALHVQRGFTGFAIQAQGLRASGAGERALHDAFGAFLEATRPTGADGPTQKPGVIGA